MAASSNFELLLFETSAICQRTLAKVETFDSRLDRVEDKVEREVRELGERVASLEKGEQHGDQERHEIVKKSETRDNTIDRCIAEARIAKQEAAAAKLESQRAKDAARDAEERAAEAVLKAGEAVAAATKLQTTIGRRGDAGKRRFTLLRIAWDALWRVIIPALVAALIALMAKGGTP
jgi:hypothetical protein